MVAAAEDDLGYAQPSPSQATRIKRWINEGYRHLMAQPGREKMRDNTITLTSVGSQASYGLPMELSKIYQITQTTNQQLLTGMTLAEYRAANPGLDQNSSFAYRYVDYGWAPVVRQPAGTGLWAVSTSAADTTQTFAVGGFLTNGDIAQPLAASAALTGVTRVQLGTLTTWDLLRRLSLSAAAAGVVSVYDAATNGNELLRLQPGQTSAQYYHIILFPTPSDALAYKIDCQLALSDLVQDNDIPLLHPDFHDMLPLYARIRDYTRAGADPRLPVAMAEWTRRGNELARMLDWPNSFAPAMGTGSGYGINNLGGWYPADFYIGGSYRG